jgi:heme/copper-type cytochrome/quinol oxidase subunit 3
MAQTAVTVVDAGAAAPPPVPSPLVLEHPHTSTGQDNRKLLMWAFLASDCMFFGTLIATYMVYKNRSLDGPLPREIFDIPYTSVSAFVLLLIGSIYGWSFESA